MTLGTRFLVGHLTMQGLTVRDYVSWNMLSVLFKDAVNWQEFIAPIKINEIQYGEIVK
jgi:hypothetical protein